MLMYSGLSVAYFCVVYMYGVLSVPCFCVVYMYSGLSGIFLCGLRGQLVVWHIFVWFT